MLITEMVTELILRVDRLEGNPDRNKIGEIVESLISQEGLVRFLVFVCPKFDTAALLSGKPEYYMPIKAAAGDLFEPRIAKLLELKDKLMRLGLPAEINLVIGDNDAEEYIFPFLKDRNVDLEKLKSRQTLYRLSFERRTENVSLGKVCAWSLAEEGIGLDQAEPKIPADAFDKELCFFRRLFSKAGPYRGKLEFTEEELREMVVLKYRLYGAQGKFLKELNGILLQTEGPGVWLERTQMLRCTGSEAVPAVYPWIRKEEKMG